MKSSLAFLIISLYLLKNVSGACDYKRVCYFENWAWYRPGEGKMSPEDIDPSLCTHIMYSFTKLNPTTLLMEVFDTWADIDNGLYKKVISFKNQGAKVMIALGGWNESGDAKYSRMVNNRAARKKFIDNAVRFIETHGFDGLDLDWEFPRCWQGNCNAGPASDKKTFGILAKELSAAFKPKGLLLSAAVSAAKPIIDKAYDVPTLGKYLDFINVMAYDYHGHWDKMTGHVAPLYKHAQDTKDILNTDYTMNYFHQLGAPKEKLIMGMPMYGQSFTLSSPSVNGLNAATSGTGQAGPITRQAGFLAYNEICYKVKNEGWTVKQPGQMGPYAFKGKQWVGYDDPAIIREKSQYIKTNGFGGGMVWAMGLDDFKNRCGDGPYPLLNVIKEVLTSDCTGANPPPANPPPANPPPANPPPANPPPANPAPPAPAPPAPAPPAPAPPAPTPPAGGKLVCAGAGAYQNAPGMAEWCNSMCNAATPYCPPSHCVCN